MPDTSFMKTLRNNWAIIVFCTSLVLAAVTGWFDVKHAVADNVKRIDSAFEQLASRATKFMTDHEFDRVWEDIKELGVSMDEVEARINALDISDERVRAKIELEIEKLRAEIQKQGFEQQKALEAQTQVMQEILREVQKD